MSLIPDSFAGVATSTARVLEMYYPPEQRLFEDPFAYPLLPPGWKLFVRLAYLPGLRTLVLAARERRMPGSLGNLLCRVRYIDDVLGKALDEGLEQLVILGAGFDSRAYRIPKLAGVQVFEVDLPGTRDLKQKRVSHVLGAVPEHVTLVGMNFDREDLSEVLFEAGFQPGLRTFFIWEGVTQYLTAEAVGATLDFVSSSSAGSGIVFTYVRRGLVEGTEGPDWFTGFLKFAERAGSPLQFGLQPDELPAYLAEHGLHLIEEVGANDFQQLYLQPLERNLSVFGGERIAYAKVTVRRQY